MINSLPKSLPETHRRFLTSSVATLERDERIVGVAAGGSFLTDAMDEFSDLDLVIATEALEHSHALQFSVHSHF